MLLNLRSHTAWQWSVQGSPEFIFYLWILLQVCWRLWARRPPATALTPPTSRRTRSRKLIGVRDNTEASSYSPAASSHASSGHASSKATPLLLASYRLRTGSDPVLNGGGERPLSSLPDPLGRPDPSSRLEAGVGKGGGAPPAEEGKMATKGAKLSPRLG